MNWPTGANRVERMKSALISRGLDGLLALTPENAAYLSGGYNFIATHWRVPGLFSAIRTAAGNLAVVAGDFGLDPSATPPYPLFTYRIWTESIDVRGVSGDDIAARVRATRAGMLDRPEQFDLDEVFDRVADAVRFALPNGGRIGIEMSQLSLIAMNRLEARLSSFELVDAGGVFEDLRVIKDADEIAYLRLAGELTELGISGAIERLNPGQTTAAVNALYQVAVHERVIADARFAAFRQAEGAASIGMGVDSPGVVAPGQTIKFDMQVDVAGYHSDIGRTVAFDPTPEQASIYGALRGALAQAQQALKPGASFADVYNAGTRAMVEAGFVNYSRGHLGHSVGLTQNFEEGPFIAPDEQRTIAPGMVLSLELPYYVYGVGAFQLERMILVTSDGHEAIDQMPFKLALVRA